jgi:hypothetical protein
MLCCFYLDLSLANKILEIMPMFKLFFSQQSKFIPLLKSIFHLYSNHILGYITSYSQQALCYCVRVMPLVLHILNSDLNIFSILPSKFSFSRTHLLVRHRVFNQNLGPSIRTHKQVYKVLCCCAELFSWFPLIKGDHTWWEGPALWYVWRICLHWLV